MYVTINLAYVIIPVVFLLCLYLLWVLFFGTYFYIKCVKEQSLKHYGGFMWFFVTDYGWRLILEKINPV